jgi:ferrous iron transport protein A
MNRSIEIPAPVPLSALALHSRAYITAIDTDALHLALLKLGVSVGNQLYLSNIAPLGDPIAIAINGTKISLRKTDAAHIWVQAQS